MFISRNKEIKKESKFATTPEEYLPEPKKKPFAKIKIFFLIWNIVSITFYSVYSLYAVNNLAQRTFLAKFIKYILGAYIIAFAILVIFGLFDQKNMKHRLKNYKSAVTFFKGAVQILNLTLSIITIITIFIATGKPDFKGIIIALFSLFLTIISLFFEIVKIIIRKNVGIIKQNFLDLHQKPRKQQK